MSIDPSSNRYFYLGCLALLLAYKFNNYEKNEIISGVEASIESVFKHIDLLKETSPILYFQFNIVRSLISFLEKENVDLVKLEELLESFKSFKVYKKFRKKYFILNKFSVTIVKCLNEFFNVSKYLLLFNFIILGVKIDYNMLQFLEIENENLINLNLKNTIIISSLMNQNNFNILTELGLVEIFRKKVTSHAEREAKTITSSELDLIKSVIEKVYDSRKFYASENQDFLSDTSSSSRIFKEARKALDLK